MRNSARGGAALSSGQAAPAHGSMVSNVWHLPSEQMSPPMQSDGWPQVPPRSEPPAITQLPVKPSSAQTSPAMQSPSSLHAPPTGELPPGPHTPSGVQ